MTASETPKPAKRSRRKRRREEHVPDEAPQEFLNRDVEWMEFNARVLHEAFDPRTPLLERLRFLGIFTSNLDEFFMKRLAGIKRQVEVGVQKPSGGLTPSQQLASIRSRASALLIMQADQFEHVIRPELREKGIDLLSWKDLSAEDCAMTDQYFYQNVFPVLTPLAVDPGLPFPFISNLSVSLGVTLKHPDREEKLFARIKVPRVFPQWIQLKPSADSPKRFRFVSLIAIIENNLRHLFPDMEILDVMPFRITRNAEVERDDEENVEDLLEMVTEEIKQRRFGDVVRLEHGPKPDPWMLKFLTDELELSHSEVYELPSLLDFTDLKPIAELPLPELRYEPWIPLVPPRLIDDRKGMFEVIREGDLLVHHPYESFGASVERFVKQAADDPKVLAIKMTLYRTGDESPFIPLLTRAAERGKQVVVLIELTARFDEERNIHWAQQLENSGVHVVYGVVGLKTHAKVALVVRQDPDMIRSYAHFGTGNYHRETAKLYTDVGLFTCRPEITDDAVELFHFLTGRSLKRNYERLLVAPINMRETFHNLILREAKLASEGQPARIIVKCNSLQDATIGRALYEASKAGVKIDLIVRGFCCVRAGVPGLSENIRVVSVIGRFLEHSRIFYFSGGNTDPLAGDFFFGSADWMYRNLTNRVETVTPIEGRPMKERLWEILDRTLKDRRQAWEMDPNGSYHQLQPRTPEEECGVQQDLIKLTRERHSALFPGDAAGY